MGGYNRRAYDKLGYHSNIRALRLSGADFSWDTIWLRRKEWKLTPLNQKYLQLVYELTDSQPQKPLF